MSERKLIPIGEFSAAPFSFVNDWLLLGVGSLPEQATAAGSINAMTVSWGMLGTVWGKPMVQVMVRPQRHSHSLIEKFPSFTLSRFSAAQRSALEFCGTASGREQDKIAQAGLHAIASTQVEAPSFREAELTIECKIVYRDRLDPQGFGADYIQAMYRNDWHFLYWGEVLAITAI